MWDGGGGTDTVPDRGDMQSPSSSDIDPHSSSSTQLLQPLSSRFTSLVRHPSFPTHCQDGPTQQSLLSILEALCGLALYTRADSVEHFFSFLLPLLQTCVELSLLYSDVAEVTGVILRLFGTVAANYVVFLDEVRCVMLLLSVSQLFVCLFVCLQAQTSKLYEVSLTLIRAYAKCNTGIYNTRSSRTPS